MALGMDGWEPEASWECSSVFVDGLHPLLCVQLQQQHQAAVLLEVSDKSVFLILCILSTLVVLMIFGFFYCLLCRLCHVFCGEDGWKEPVIYKNQICWQFETVWGTVYADNSTIWMFFVCYSQNSCCGSDCIGAAHISKSPLALSASTLNGLPSFKKSWLQVSIATRFFFFLFNFISKRDFRWPESLSISSPFLQGLQL